MRFGFKILSLCSLAMLMACSNVNDDQAFSTQLVTNPDPVSIRIAEASDRAAKALDVMARIDQRQQEQQFAGKPDARPNYANAPAALLQPMTVRWSGPVEQMLRILAARAGMDFHSIGNPPSAPLTVNVDVYREPLIRVLRSIGLQAGRRAVIAVDASGSAIEIRYVDTSAL